MPKILTQFQAVPGTQKVVKIPEVLEQLPLGPRRNILTPVLNTAGNTQITLPNKAIIQIEPNGITKIVDAAGKPILGAESIKTGNIISQILTLALTEGEGDAALKMGKSNYVDEAEGIWLGLQDADPTNRAKMNIGGAEKFIKYTGDDFIMSVIAHLYKSLNLKSYTVATLPTTNSGYDSPSALGAATEWTNGANAYASDDVRATTNADAKDADYKTFGIDISGMPAGGEVVGIIVSCEGQADAADALLSIYLSWDGGVSWTTAQSKLLPNGADGVILIGGADFKWGKTWTAAMLNDTNFRIKVRSVLGSATLIQLDHIQVKVFYTVPTDPVQPGALAYASDGRKAGEGAGAGTGVLVFYDKDGDWVAVDTGLTVAA